MQPRIHSSLRTFTSSSSPILNKPLSALLSLVLFSICTLFIRSILYVGWVNNLSEQRQYELFVDQSGENTLLMELNDAQEEEQSQATVENADDGAVMHEDPSDFAATTSTPVDPDPVPLVATNEAGNDDDKSLSFSTGIHLVTTFFRGKYSPERVAELLTSLKRNLSNPYLSHVHVLWQDVSPASFVSELAPFAHKLVLRRVLAQPTYEQFFDYVNAHLKRGTIAIIANGDIYFDKSLECLKVVDQSSAKFAWKPGMGKRPIFGLTRRHAAECGDKPDYNDIYDLCDHYIGSHDVFVFAPPVSHDISSQLNHTQNWGLGAENIVIWEMNHSGEWRAFNPCDMVRANHLHCTGERAWSKVDEKNKLVFVSGAKFHNGVRKHGWIKPWYWRKTISCPYELF